MWRRRLAVLIFRTTLLSVLAFSSDACGSCLWKVLQDRSSPSGSLRAVVIAGQCGTVSGFQVGLAKSGQSASDATRVFKTLLPKGADVNAAEFADAVSAEWLGENKLRVRYPAWLYPAQQETTFGDVVVEYEAVVSEPPRQAQPPP